MTEFTLPPIEPAPEQPAPARLRGGRRAIASVLLTVGLFAVGGTAVALAADPSPTPAPSTSTQPSTGGSAPSTQPSTGGSAPSGRPNHAGGRDCPMGGGSVARVARVVPAPRRRRRPPRMPRRPQRLTFNRRPDRSGRRFLTHLGLVGLAVAACSPAAGLTSGSSSAATASTGTSAGTGTPLAIGGGLSGPAGMSATVVATGLPNVAGLAVDQGRR